MERKRRVVRLQKTEVFLSITKFCEEVHRGVTMGIVHGSSGLGKTTALRNYVSKSRAVAYYEVPDETASRKSLLEGLLVSLGGYAVGKSIFDLKKQIIDILLDKGIECLVVDQANFVKAGSFNMLNAIREASDISLILAGTNKLPHIIKSANRSLELEQFYSRVEYSLQLSNITKKNVALFLVGCGLEQNGDFSAICDFVFERCRDKGSFRTVSNMYERAQQLMVFRKDEVLTFEHFQLSCKLIL